jgi:N6-L-threonylcarbamoyladenine synthase
MTINLVLGLETSCDETSFALLKVREDNSKPEILDMLTYSQVDLYRDWGGVVPEIASRNHLAKIMPLFKEILEKNNVSISEIDLIGVTTNPGLLGPLLMGLSHAKSLSLLYKIPLYAANHLRAHIEAIHLTQEVPYPYVGAILSGGHSLFVEVRSAAEMIIHASTIDDAAGEAFDKGGKILGLDYPAGAQIDQLAKSGDRKKYNFPIGLKKQNQNSNMSFSGIKTSLKQLVEKDSVILEKDFENICASYQEGIVQSVLTKFKIFYQNFIGLPIVIGGGVGCNSRLKEIFLEFEPKTNFVIPKYCTDNAAMIANLAYRDRKNAMKFPESLHLESQSRYIQKSDFIA